MIKYECPKCGWLIKSSDRLAGDEVICPKCDAGVTVPLSKLQKKAVDQEDRSRQQAEDGARQARVTSPQTGGSIPVVTGEVKIAPAVLKQSMPPVHEAETVTPHKMGRSGSHRTRRSARAIVCKKNREQGTSTLLSKATGLLPLVFRRCIILVGVAVIAAMTLFPPYRGVYNPLRPTEGSLRRKENIDCFVGYYYVFAPPGPEVVYLKIKGESPTGKGDRPDSVFRRYESHLDTDRLTMQFIAVTLITCGLAFAFRPRARKKTGSTTPSD